MNAIVEKIQLLKLPFMMDTPTKGAGNCFFEAILQQCEHRPELQLVGSFVLAKVQAGNLHICANCIISTY